MKKLLVVLFAVFALVGVAACEGIIPAPTVESLTVEGQQTDFIVGDTFDDGDLVVTATYSDATSKVVTDYALTHDADMNVAGTYTVTVSYEGKSVTYQISVADPDLVAISVDAADAKVSYTVGDTISYEGVEVVASYENETTSTVTDYTVVVKDVNGEVVADVFTTLGTYTVTVTYGDFSDSYNVVVEVPTYETVVAAINGAIVNEAKVNGETVTVTSWGSDTVYTSNFGDNYCVVTTDSDTTHYSLIDAETVFGVTEGTDWSGAPVLNPAWDPVVENMNGYKFNVLGYDFFGTEAVVKGVYDYALETAATITETVVDGVYSFSYACSAETSWGSIYYYNVTVSFEVSAAGTMDNVHIVEDKYYSDSVVVAEDGSWTVAEGIEVADVQTIVSVVQSVGPRDLVNEYTADKLLYASFDLVDANGEVLAEDEYDLASGTDNQLVLTVGNVLPETAVADLDELTVEVTDEYGAFAEGIYAYYNSWSGELTVYGTAEGTYVLTVKSKNVVKTYKFNVTLANPSSIDSQVYTDENGYPTFETKSSHKMYLGSTLYVKANTPQYTKNGYTAQLSMQSMMGSALTEATVDGTACYAFEAYGLGLYQVIFTSTADSNVYSVLEIEVVPAPDMADVLSGTHEFGDMYSSNTGTIEFTPSAEGALDGTLSFYYSEFSYMYWDYVTYEGTYNYTYADGVLAITPTLEYTFTLELSVTASYKVQAVVDGWTTLMFEQVEEVVVDPSTGSAEYNGTWTATDSYGWTMTIVFDELFGTAEISETDGHDVNTGTYVYEVTASGLTFTFVNGHNFMEAGLEFVGKGSVIEVSCYGAIYYELTKVASEGEDSVGDGTDTNPYIISATGDFTCAFPGGWNYVFYAVEATTDCEVTVTVTSSDYYWAYAINDPYASTTEGAGSSNPTHTVKVAAGEVLYICMSTNSTGAADITFSVVIE